MRISGISFPRRTTPYLLGVLNITPDSFYPTSRVLSESAITSRAVQMVSEGADIIDVGGESTRPGSSPISRDEELERVIGAIRAIRRACGIPISVDTTKAEVAEKAIQTLVDNFPDDRLDQLVRKHVAPALSPDCARGPWNALAGALKERGVQAAHSDTGWHLSWSDNDTLEGGDLCRLALLAVWLRGMRLRSTS